MTKLKSTRLKNKSIVINIYNKRALELCQKMIWLIVYTIKSSIWKAKKTTPTMRNIPVVILIKIIWKTMINKGVAPMTERWSYTCHVHYLTHWLNTRPKWISHFSMGSTYFLPPMTAKFRLLKTIIKCNSHLILPTTSHMTSTLSLSLDKPHLPREKTEKTTTQALTARWVPPFQPNL